MKPMPSHPPVSTAIVSLALLLWLPGCAAEDDDPTQTSDAVADADVSEDDSTTTTPDTATDDTSAMSVEFPSDCTREAIESDFQTFGPMTGPAVDPETGAVTLPPGAIVTTTYLAMRGTAASGQAFGEVLEPVLGTLRASEGVLVSGLGNSMRCGTARTLTVFEDPASMMAFVASEAHLAAIGRVGEISRGTSVTDHYEGLDGSEVTWEGVAARLSSHEGPTY